MTSHYGQIEKILEYLANNWKSQPNLEALANQAGMSHYHFQRLFSEWVGISPKKFLQHLTYSHSKDLLRHASNIEAPSLDIGLSSTSRIYDLYISATGMTPGEYKKYAEGVTVTYGWHETLFGETLIAATERGLCGLAFLDHRSHEACENDLLHQLPNAKLERNADVAREYCDQIFRYSNSGSDHHSGKHGSRIKLLLRGTKFQQQVWRALLAIPPGELRCYGDIAVELGMPRTAARAVGTAVGDNLISWLIPCHRVINQTAALGGYRWGLGRKLAMLGMERSVGAPFVHSNYENNVDSVETG